MAVSKWRGGPASGPRTFLFLPFALGVSLAVFASFTAAHQFQMNDSPAFVAYGFPVPWHRANGAISMAREVDVKAALFDFGFYFLPLFGLAVSLRGTLAKRPRLTNGFTVVMLLLGVIGVVLAVGADTGTAPINPATSEIISRVTIPHFGWNFR